MIYDIFTFNGEYEMLDIRIKILFKYVDYFVIVEANETFSGEPKEFYYEKIKHKYTNIKNKIIYHKINDTPFDVNDIGCNQEYLRLALSSDNVTYEHVCWLKEFYQKEAIKDALKHLNDEDICYVSDIDEIWNYRIQVKFDEKIYKYNIDYCFIEYLNVRTTEDWTYFTGPISTKYKNIKNSCLNHIRTYRKMKDIYSYIENGGWHFNALGGINKKIESFKHPLYTLEYMKGRMNGLYIDEINLPEYILINKENLKHLFL